MAIQNFDNLRTRAQTIKTETIVNANDELRVGGLIEDIVDTVENNISIDTNLNFTQSLDFSTYKTFVDYDQVGAINFTLAAATHTVGSIIAVKINGDGTNLCGFSTDFKVFGTFDNTKQNFITFYCHAINEIWVTVLNGDVIEVGGSYPMDGLLAYWDFEEASGNFLDKTANGKDLERTNATTAAGFIGNAAVFNGTNAYVQSLVSTGLSRNTGLTIAGWIKVNTALGVLLQKGITGSANLEYACWLSNWSGNEIHFETSVNGSTVLAQKATLGAGLGVWQFIAVIWDGTNKYIRTNATISSPQANASMFAGNGLLRLGARPDNSNYMDGEIDQFRIYDRALTTLELDQLYNAGAGV